MAKARHSFPWDIAGAITLKHDTHDGRLEEVADDVGADGGEEAEQHHVLVKPSVHAEFLDAARAGKIQITVLCLYVALATHN